MHAKNYVRATIAGSLALVLSSACSKSHSPAPISSTTPPDDDLGISLATMPLLATNCTFATGVLTVTVKDGESAYLTLRPDDGYVVVNANMAAGGGAGSGATGAGSGASGSSGSGSSGTSGSTLPQCATAPTNSIKIQSDTSGAVLLGRAVILDYINGIFMKSPSATVTGIKIDFTLANDNNGAKNSLKIRGSQGNDAFVFGAGTAAGSALNLNPPAAPASGAGSGAAGSGAMAGTDQFPDVIFAHVAQVMIAAGMGNDRIDASGVSNAGVGTVYTTAVSLFGNEGDDVIVGGTGDDLLVGGIGNDIMKGCAGNDYYDMGGITSGNDIIAQSCTGSAATEGSDTLDYSKRTNNITLTFSTTLAAASNPASDVGMTSGEMGETSRISDNIATIKMGAGNDTITVPTGSLVKHTIFGGAGDDKYIGNGVADIFDGEGGDDTCQSAVSTMDYSSAARMAGVVVSLCSMSCTAAVDSNDGDQSATAVTKMGTAAATTVAGGGIDISVVSSGASFTTASVGNTLHLANCAMGTQNDGDYKIVAFVSPTSVKVKVPSSISGFAADTACDYSEALPNGMTNAGAGAATAAKTTSASVTGLPSQVRGLGRTLRLTHSATTSGGGATHSDDDGTYRILEVLMPDTSVAIDELSPVLGGTTYAGGANALDWVIQGPESDNVGCAHVIGTRFADTITGDQNANTLRGGAGDDTLNGGAGNDNLYGEAGNDSLYGGPGEDSLIGSIGMDTLVGGDGTDVLEGDADPDVFTCDGKNSSTAAMDGTLPGDSDIRVDYVGTGSMPDTLGMNHGCEF